MVKKTFAFALLITATITALASNQCSSGSEFEPPLCPLNLPKISKISIEENAAKSPADQDPQVNCSTFILTVPQIRSYFMRASATNQIDAHHTLDWSPCYASGQISFSDGRHGKWNIDQFRRGELVMSDGKKIVIYCPRCRFHPFQY